MARKRHLQHPADLVSECREVLFSLWYLVDEYQKTRAPALKPRLLETLGEATVRFHQMEQEVKHLCKQ